METVVLQGPDKDRVKAGNVRPKAQGRTDQSVGAGSDAARTECRSASGSAGLCADATDASARSVEYHAHRCAQNTGPSSGAQDVGVGDIQVEARDGDIEVVFEREGDGVVERKIEFAIMHELVNTRSIRQIWRRQMPGRIRSDWIREMRDRLGIIQHRERTRFRSVLRSGRDGWLLCPACDGQSCE